MAEKKLADSGVWISVIAYIILAVLKITIGFIAHSEALKADGLNNSTDILASIGLLIGLKISRKPIDHNHPYGHVRAENISSLVASFIMFAVGLQVLFDSVRALFSHEQPIPEAFAAWVGVFAAVVMFFVYLYNKRLSEKADSQALRAAAKDNLSDALVSVGAVIGIIGSQINLPWLDPVAATVVGIFICKTGWDIFKEATLLLTDAFDQDRLESFRVTIESVYGVEKVVELKGRMQGNQPMVDVIIEVVPTMTVYESHLITDKVEATMRNEHQAEMVHIHVEPGPFKKLKDDL
jgi:cation diffusion facilitator family transporter